MRVSSFKQLHGQPPPRSATPPRPVWEPLSPILRPQQPPSANPAAGTTTDVASSSNGLSALPHRDAPQDVRPLASMLPLPAAPMYEPSPSSAPLPLPQQPPRGAPYSPALRSPIEALTDAAMPSLYSSPTHVDPSRRSAQLPASPATFAHPPGLRAPKHPFAIDGNHPYSERPAKRARSDYFSPQPAQQNSRPATSHIPNWSYNVEQMVDNAHRMYQDTAPPVQQADSGSLKRLSDAQLLMDFAVAASSSTPQHNSSSKRWSISNHEAPSPYSHHMYADPHNQYLGQSPVSPFARYHGQPVDSKHALGLAPMASEHKPHEYSMQSETLLDDYRGATVLRTANEAEVASGTKPKKHQGWPKGKPRGPRNNTPTSKKKKSATKSKAQTATSVPEPSKPGPLSQSSTAVQQTASVPEAVADAVPAPASHEPGQHARRYSFAGATPMLGSENVSRTFTRASSLPLGPATSTATRVPLPISENVAEPITICASCGTSDSDNMIGDGEQWIRCDGCSEWHHYGCAGFQSEREVRDVDKFYCERCRPRYGETTKVRKSTRAHTAVDYAGLNEGIVKTSDDNPEHHYIAAFKSGDITFTPETFARMPPELVSADFLEKTNGFKEPILIPADLNPRPQYPGRPEPELNGATATPAAESDLHFTYEMVPDDGQDKLDMVIPQGLTVRRVSELYGPQERVPVIDVKAQEGEDKRWTMAKWADYYEQQGEKPVRNVISLEVSKSRLGRLIRRPKAVRDLDLQDSVWRDDDKKAPPAVQFYCLMSVADCYTDFHIDFGGSSVYYHIVKGRKVFFFIPPTKQNLKKYEDWCLSPMQGHEWLGDQVKECYRVDLYPGDTMLIPSGWIHAVWTPEDSLVIGGNFLTRVHYGMQIKVLEIEKNTKVAAKFRYPFFQKLMWLSLVRYLEEDPLPLSVEQLLLGGAQFKRDVPTYCETDKFGHNSHLGPENYHRRYYSKAELEGLSDLVQYIWRTVLISLGRIDGITDKVRKSVTGSIPKGFGEPLVLAKRFAAWIAWKRGNECIPQWAQSDAVLPDASENPEKKLSAAEIKRLEKQALGEGLRANSERHTSRTRTSEPLHTNGAESQSPALVTPPPALPPLPMFTGFLQKTDPSRPQTTPKTSQLGPKRIACDACRKRRIRCKHKDEIFDPTKPAGLVGGLHTIDLSGSLGLSVKRRYSDFGASQGQQSSVSEKSMSNGGPLLADTNGDPYALKSGRVKACADCRKSKRRCIHDEYGNVDPVKANEIPIPRGAAAKKRRISEEDGVSAQQQFNKAATVESMPTHGLHRRRESSSGDFGFGGAVELHELAFSARKALDQVADDDAMPIDPALQTYERGNDFAVTDASPRAPSGDAVMFSVEEFDHDPMEGVQHTVINGRSGPSIEPLSPIAGPNGLYGMANGVGDPHISPHANSDGNLVPPQTPNGPRSKNTGFSKRKASQTPRSSHQKSKTPSHRRQDSKDSIKLEPQSEPKVRATSSTFANKEEDTASLALALQLQMEEHGLRRRSMI